MKLCLNMLKFKEINALSKNCPVSLKNHQEKGILSFRQK